MASELKPCGGCGATSDRERCIGCLHDFGTTESAWVRTDLSPGAVAIGKVLHGDEGELDDLTQSQIRTLNIAATLAAEAELATRPAPAATDTGLVRYDLSMFGNGIVEMGGGAYVRADQAEKLLVAAMKDRLPNGHMILEQSDTPDGRVSQTVRVDATGEEYERIVHADEAYGEEE